MGGRGGGSRTQQQVDVSLRQTPGAARDDQRLAEVIQLLGGRAGLRGDYVSLSAVRDRMSGISRDRQDAAITRLLRTGRGSVLPEGDIKSLRPKDRAAAFRWGGENNHLIRLRV